MHSGCFARTGTDSIKLGSLKEGIQERRFAHVGATEKGDFGCELVFEAVVGRVFGFVPFAPFVGGPELARRMCLDEIGCCCELGFCRWYSVPVVC